MTGGVGDELLLSRIPVVDRASGDEGGVGGQILHEDILLGAVTTADAGLDDVDPVLREAGDFRADPPDMVRHLGGSVEDQPPALHFCEADVWLQRRMLDLARLVRAVHHRVGLREGFVDIADASAVGGRDIPADVGAQRELVDHLAFPAVAGPPVVFVQIRRGPRVIEDRAVVDQRCAVRHRFLYGEDGRLHVVVDPDQVPGLLGDLPRLGDHRGYAVPHMPYLHIEKPAVMRRRLRFALSGLHVVDVRAVEGRDDADDAGKFLRLGGVDPVDVGAGVRRAEDDQAAGVRRHVVFDKGAFSGYELGAVDLSGGFSDTVKRRTEGRRDFALVGAGFDSLFRETDGEIVVLIAGVADKDPGQRVADLLPGRMGMLLEQPGEEQGRGRGVVGALHHAGVNHGLLHHGEMGGVRQPVRRADFASVRLEGEHQVCVHGDAVHQNGVAAAETFAVVAVADGKMTVGHQKLTELHGRLYVKTPAAAVEDALDRHVGSPPFSSDEEGRTRRRSRHVTASR